MRNQEIFDIVATHLFTQGERSFTSMKGCLYRGPNNTMCAVGCLIPDEVYDPYMEGGTVDTVLYDYPQLKFKRNLDLLLRLQTIHDSLDSWESTTRMKTLLRTVAKQFKLKPTVLENLKFKDR